MENLSLENSGLGDWTLKNSSENLQRKSVICSLKDLANISEERDIINAEEPSVVTSSIVYGHCDSAYEIDNESSGKKEMMFELLVNPAEVECVATDSSDDEASDREERDHLDGKLKLPHEISQPEQLMCCLCDYVVLDGGGQSLLMEHLQHSHNFCIRRLVHDDIGTNQDLKNLRIKRVFQCCKEQGGCGRSFCLKHEFISHHQMSKNTVGSCRGASSREQVKPLFVCTICSFECAERIKIIQHLNICHDSIGNLDKEREALAYRCRICKSQFWTVAERGEHEVSSHPVEASYLILRCHICRLPFSSKGCLKKHLRKNHISERQFTNNVGFRCRVCLATFPTFPLIQEHFHLLHQTLLGYHCLQCNLLLKTKRTYKAHLKNSKCGSVPDDSGLCKKVSWTKGALSVHHNMKHCSSCKVCFSCKICKRKFESKLERDQHSAINHPGTTLFNCPACSKGFASKSGMYGHLQSHIKTTLLKCELCGKEFSRKDSYNEHLRIHSGKRHKCPHCDKLFVQQSNLVRHIRIHTGEKPYKCQYCEKTFSDKGACNSHNRTHTREEACSCPYCGQVFSKKQKLKYHLRKHTGEDLVSCEFCGKSFTNSHYLKEHSKIHDKNLDVVCSKCGKTFATTKYLQRHISLIHEAILIHDCPLCTRKFSQPGRLKTHLMTHTGIKYLRCLMCLKSYSSRGALRIHLLNVHSVTKEHPDYRQSFYALTPEEAGLEIPRCEVSSNQLLKLSKQELISAGCNSDQSSSGEEKRSFETLPLQSYQLECQNSSTLPTLLFSNVKTKAARKQLPINIILNDQKSSKSKISDYLPQFISGKMQSKSKHLMSLKRSSRKQGQGLSLSTSTAAQKLHANVSESTKSESFSVKSSQSSQKLPIRSKRLMKMEISDQIGSEII